VAQWNNGVERVFATLHDASWESESGINDDELCQALKLLAHQDQIMLYGLCWLFIMDMVNQINVQLLSRARA